MFSHKKSFTKSSAHSNHCVVSTVERRDNNKGGFVSGFTLIELLVGVLIIGILAAVALPQYQLAVARSRFATLKNLTTSLVKAQEVYYLAHDRYATDFADLDIQLPFQKLENKYGYFEGGRCWMNTQAGGENQVGCVDTRVKMSYQAYLSRSKYVMARSCVVVGIKDKDCSTIQCKVCQHETGKIRADTSGTSSDDWTSWWY